MKLLSSFSSGVRLPPRTRAPSGVALRGGLHSNSQYKARFESIVPCASAPGPKRGDVAPKAAAVASPTAVVPSTIQEMGPNRGDTTGATMVVDDVWVQVSGQD